MARVAMLWPGGGVAALPVARLAGPPLMPANSAAPFAKRQAEFPSRRSPTNVAHADAVPLSPPATHRITALPKKAIVEQRWADDIGGLHSPAMSVDQRDNVAQLVAPGLPLVRPTTRFSGSAWALVRSDGAPSLATGGQLGGSQIGMRLFYTPGPRPLAITARVSTPLSQPNGREAAVGLALRGHNVGIIAEQRIALDKGRRSVPAIFAYGGMSGVNVGHRFKLDGYLQTGVVGIKDTAGFVDGAVRVERPVLKGEKASLSIGAGAWGGAQVGASRVDIGPQIVARMAVAKTDLRISAEWRQRVAGDAAPESGPSVTIGFDF